MRWFRNNFKYWWYFALAFLVLAPLYKPGYILTLDMVFTPVIRMPTTVDNSFLLQALLHVMNIALPSDIIEKIILSVILLLAGVGIHRLTLSFPPRPDTYRVIGAYVAGTLYVINPFTYDRFMAGQYDVLFGLALLPWFTRALITFLAEPMIRNSLILAAWAIFFSIVSIHGIGFMAILAIIAAELAYWQHREDKIWQRNVLKFSVLTISTFLIASLYWLMPLALGHGSTAININSFGANDLNAFATVGDGWLGQLGNVMQLQGFWLEARDMYNPPQRTVQLGIMLVLLLWTLVAVGAIYMWRTRQRSRMLLFGCTAFIAAILAIGLFNRWLALHVPFFSGYREPQKFVMLIILAFAVFVSYGTATTLRYIHKQGGTLFFVIASVLLILLPAVWTPTIWWGLNGQLAPVQYPADWYALNRRLDTDHESFNTIFLPWHLYMYFNFSNRIITNPTPAFFDKPVIISDNPEYKGASLSNSTPAKRQLDQLLPRASNQFYLGSQLAKLNIKYVILDKDADYMNYIYLNKQHDLKLVSNGGTLELYVNNAWREQ